MATSTRKGKATTLHAGACTVHVTKAVRRDRKKTAKIALRLWGLRATCDGSSAAIGGPSRFVKKSTAVKAAKKWLKQQA